MGNKRKTRRKIRTRKPRKGKTRKYRSPRTRKIKTNKQRGGGSGNWVQLEIPGEDEGPLLLDWKNSLITLPTSKEIIENLMDAGQGKLCEGRANSSWSFNVGSHIEVPAGKILLENGYGKGDIDTPRTKNSVFATIGNKFWIKKVLSKKLKIRLRL